jgi:hypothetical protein
MDRPSDYLNVFVNAFHCLVIQLDTILQALDYQPIEPFQLHLHILDYLGRLILFLVICNHSKAGFYEIQLVFRLRLESFDF